MNGNTNKREFQDVRVFHGRDHRNPNHIEKAMYLILNKARNERGDIYRSNLSIDEKKQRIKSIEDFAMEKAMLVENCYQTMLDASYESYLNKDRTSRTITMIKDTIKNHLEVPTVEEMQKRDDLINLADKLIYQKCKTAMETLNTIFEELKMNCRFKNLDNQDITLQQANIILMKDVINEDKYKNLDNRKMQELSSSANLNKLEKKEEDIVHNAGKRELFHAMDGAGFKPGDLNLLLEKQKFISFVQMSNDLDKIAEKTAKEEIEVEVSNGKVKDDAVLVWKDPESGHGL